MRVKIRVGTDLAPVWRIGSALLAFIAGGTAAAFSGAEPDYLGTFSFVQRRSTGEFNVIVVNVDARSGGVQVVGTVANAGSAGGDIKGTYYPGSNSIRGTVKQRGVGKPEMNLDGKFIAGESAFDVWTDGPQGKGSVVRIRRLDAGNVEGTYAENGSSLTIKRSAAGLGISGSYAGRQVRGSFYLRSNSIAARATDSVRAPIVIDGHYDPTEDRLCIWWGVDGGGPDTKEYAVISRLGANKPKAPDVVAGDPATKPGAVWQESETYRVAIDGTWTLDTGGSRFKARWVNGAEADLTLVQCTATSVVVTRDDKTGVSKGLKATYRGKRTGNKVSGDVDWEWADGKKGKGTWSATLPN